MKPISKVLLEFIEPLLRASSPSPDRRELEMALRIAVTVWNAVVMEQAGFGQPYLAEARERIESEALPAAVQVFESLVEHKHQAFEADRRLILDYRVVEAPDGRLGVQVDAGQLDDAPPERA